MPLKHGQLYFALQQAGHELGKLDSRFLVPDVDYAKAYLKESSFPKWSFQNHVPLPNCIACMQFVSLSPQLKFLDRAYMLRSIGRTLHLYVCCLHENVSEGLLNSG